MRFFRSRLRHTVDYVSGVRISRPDFVSDFKIGGDEPSLLSLSMPGNVCRGVGLGSYSWPVHTPVRGLFSFGLCDEKCRILSLEF